jgi:transposase InsO family protein
MIQRCTRTIMDQKTRDNFLRILGALDAETGFRSGRHGDEPAYIEGLSMINENRDKVITHRRYTELLAAERREKERLHVDKLRDKGYGPLVRAAYRLEKWLGLSK